MMCDTGTILVQVTHFLSVLNINILNPHRQDAWSMHFPFSLPYLITSRNIWIRENRSRTTKNIFWKLSREAKTPGVLSTLWPH